MAAKNTQDLRNFDWDDTELIKAYNKGAAILKNGREKPKKKGNASKENTVKQWKVGDCCRAEYSADNLMYEAKIRSIKDGRCTIEFIGYGDQETVSLKHLKNSSGKKARKQQYKTALNTNSTASESVLNTTDTETESRRSSCVAKHLNESQVNHAPYDYTAAENSFHVPQHLPLPIASHSHPTVNYAHVPACCAPPGVPGLNPMLPAPPAPPMPQCPSVAQNPSLSAMLVSWYMAGYYTGLNQGQKGPQCSQHCCSRANRCCH